MSDEIRLPGMTIRPPARHKVVIRDNEPTLITNDPQGEFDRHLAASVDKIEELPRATEKAEIVALPPAKHRASESIGAWRRRQLSDPDVPAWRKKMMRSMSREDI